jgi:hypothetical protein
VKLKYIEKIATQNIDLEKLRPGKSYDFLIKNRNGDLTEIIGDEEKLNKWLRVLKEFGPGNFIMVIIYVIYSNFKK